MIDEFFQQQAAATTSRQKKELIKRLRHFGDPRDPALDPLVMMDLAELATGLDRHANPEAFRKRRTTFIETFALTGTNAEVAMRPSVIATLLHDLGIRRFMTLNYDLELEWSLLVSEAEKTGQARPRSEIWGRIAARLKLPADAPSGHPATRLQRYLTGRGKVTSDLLDRDRSEILTEFALGTPWPEYQILHLHGRADSPENLLVTKRDYRDRYWQTGFSKLPFEYGMRLIFSGNPVLFVGVGAKEPDVMRTLEQFLSDNPNRRAVPVFLLWNSPGTLEAAQVRRLGLYRQYGIHVLFDHEIARIANCPNYARLISAPLSPPPATSKPLPPLERRHLVNARRLEEPVKLLGKISAPKSDASSWIPVELRSPQDKFGDPDARRIDMWRHDGAPDPAFDNPQYAAERLVGGCPIKAIIGEPGSGRGAVAKAIAAAFEARDKPEPFELPDRVVLINGSFAIETDSIFGILSGASDGKTAQKEGISRAKALTKIIHALTNAEPATLSREPDPGLALQAFLKGHRRTTIIVNSMERFIGHDGSALSVELDNLIRRLIDFYNREPNQKGFLERWGEFADNVVRNTDERFDPPINLILIGTPRVKRYLSAISDDIDYLRLVDVKGRPNATSLVPESRNNSPEWSLDLADSLPYFRCVAEAFGAGTVCPSPTMEKLGARRSFFRQILKEETLAAAGVDKNDIALCFEILRTLAFIGQPVEREVLRHVPKIAQLVGGDPSGVPAAVKTALAHLQRLKLILPIRAFLPSVKTPRLGLHKAVVAELRERFGVPLSDARLSGGFNLSLSVAQAVDSAAPELAWHGDLGHLIDFLAGAFADRAPPLHGKAKAILRSPAHDNTLPPHVRSLSPDQRCAMASEEYSACLRAALSIMRSFYSVPSLLMQPNRDLDPWMRDGPLSEHAERLSRLLRMGRSAATLRTLVRNQVAASLSLDPEKENDRQDIDNAVLPILGPNAFYPDDLVWLHNELGVLRATQGELFQAEHAFREALLINDRFVEPGDRQQNWRRIQLNLTQVGIDRGEIEVTEERLRDLEAELEAQACSFGTLSVDGGACGDIITKYAGDVRPSVGVRRSLPIRIDKSYPTDLILAVGLVQGFKGQCLHLRGALDAAKACLSDALSILLRLNEQRAYAYFQRQAAALHAAFGHRDAAREALTLCIAAAGPARQTDIDNSGRVALVQYDLVESPAQRPPWIMQLSESLRYATAGDMFRLQLECMQCLAQIYLRHGDTDSALRYTNDAMAVAARCGFGLRAVSLRILMAKILAFRGDKASARALLESAEQIATKMRYERAVEAAENEMIKLA